MLRRLSLMLIVTALTSCASKQLASISEKDEYQQITVLHQNGTTIKEFRNKGRIYMVEVTPKHGKSYFIYPDQLNQQQTLNPDLHNASGEGVKWTIKEF